MLAKDIAIKIAEEWVQHQAPTTYRGWNQFRWLLDQLAALCVVESLTNGEGTPELRKRLSKAYEILESVQYAGAPEIATRFWFEGVNEKPSESEQKIVDKAKATVWTRRDPGRSFQEGYESEHYTAFDRDDFYGTVARYLQEPWLRHPYLDWIMVDMLVTRELSLYGEVLKRGFMPGPRNVLLGTHALYFKANGNVQKMKLWGLFARALWAVVVPIGSIYTLFHFGYGSVGLGLFGLYAAWLALQVLRFVIRIGYALVGKTHPLAKPFLLWNEMYEVWKVLKGPIVNPTLVREMMVKTRDEGAVWDVPAWSIIDRVIQHDPAVWVVQPTR